MRNCIWINAFWLPVLCSLWASFNWSFLFWVFDKMDLNIFYAFDWCVGLGSVFAGAQNQIRSSISEIEPWLRSLVQTMILSLRCSLNSERRGNTPKDSNISHDSMHDGLRQFSISTRSHNFPFLGIFISKMDQTGVLWTTKYFELNHIRQQIQSKWKQTKNASSLSL